MACHSDHSACILNLLPQSWCEIYNRGHSEDSLLGILPSWRETYSLVVNSRNRHIWAWALAPLLIVCVTFSHSKLQVCGIGGYVAAWGTGIAYGHWFLSQQLHFQPSSLLVPEVVIEDSPSTCAPAFMRKTQEKLMIPDFSLAKPWLLQPFVKLSSR